jgi:hypothetical protein
MPMKPVLLLIDEEKSISPESINKDQPQQSSSAADKSKKSQKAKGKKLKSSKNISKKKFNILNTKLDSLLAAVK